MNTSLLPLLLCAAASGAALAPPPQDPPPDPAHADGAPPALAPGVLPPDTAQPARELWGELLAQTLGREPIQAFDLSFWMRHRSQDGRQQNDLDARYRFLMPGFVRVQLQSGREHLRGPRGDFLIDGDQIQPLTARSHVEDRRQLSETVAIARNFLSLTDPARLRIVRLARRDAPPIGLPPGLASRAAELDWLEITSPDFHLAGDGRPAAWAAARPADAPRLYRAVLGLERGDRRIALAVVHEEVAGALALSPSTMLVQLGQHRDLDGYRIPHRLLVHEVDLEQSPWAFRERATSELSLKPKPTTIGLRPALAPEHFVP